MSPSRTFTLGLTLALAALVVAACGDDDATPAVDSGAAVSVCSLTGGAASPPCTTAPVVLSAAICRCGSRYYWDGSACIATAACDCFGGCEFLYETMAACDAAYAMCRDGGP